VKRANMTTLAVCLRTRPADQPVFVATQESSHKHGLCLEHSMLGCFLM
jgi:hypothetical protein